MGRKHARRRKATSVALAGAVAASPATPLLAVAGAQTSSGVSGAVDPGPSETASRALLQRGSVGDAVAQVQARIGVDDDGIFGPITERAVRRFQAAHGLAPTGVVDAATWAAIFRAKVVFVKESSPSDPPRRSSPRRGGAGEKRTERLSADLREDPAPAPKPAAPVAILSDDCSTVTPVRGVRTGDFGESRPGHTHAGIDIAAPAGTPVKAAACGRVVQAGPQSGYGNLVCIEHAGGTTTCYAHLSTIGARMRQWVDSGQVIGTVGCTGNCTGPHLHFEVRENGRPVDPSGYVNGTRTLPRGSGGTGGSYPGADSAPRTTGTGAKTSRRARTSTWGDSEASVSSATSGSGEGWTPTATATAPATSAAERRTEGPAPVPAQEAPPAPPTPAPVQEAPPDPAPAPAPSAEPAADSAPVQEAPPAPSPTPVQQPAPAPVQEAPPALAPAPSPSPAPPAEEAPAAAATPAPVGPAPADEQAATPQPPSSAPAAAPTA
ncbi:MAG TPA: peptidoglycan DD-metalloendopeptidase family protein [Solirubrobacteraceae bacterium]